MNLKDLKDYKIEDESPKSKPLNISDIGNDYEVEDSEDNSIGKLESGLRGAAQSVSYGTADELTAGAETAAKTLFGADKLSDLMDNYRKYRTESRADYKAAEEANPGSYLTGEIGGGVAAGLLTGGAGAVANLGKVGLQQGAKELAKIGLKQGAAAGFGSSEGDLTQGDLGELGQVAKDTAIGGTLGASLGAALPTVTKGAGKALGAVGDFAMDKAPTVFKKGKAAFNLAKEGFDVVGDKAEKALDKESRQAAKDIIAGFRRQSREGSVDIGKALKSLPEGADFSKVMTEVEDSLSKSNMRVDDYERALRELKQFKTTNMTETVIPGLDTATKKMEDITAKAKSASSALGEDISFSPVENIDNKFLQSVKTQKAGDQIIDSTKSIQEGTGLLKGKELMSQKIAKQKAEAAQLGQQVNITEPIFDKESNSLISTVTSKDSNGSEIAKTISQKVPNDSTLNIPTFGDKNIANVMQVDIPEDQIIKEYTESFKNMDLQELNNVKMGIDDLLSGDTLTSYGKKILQETRSKLDGTIKTSMSTPNKELFEAGSAARTKSYNAGDLIGTLSPKKQFLKDADIKLQSQLLKPEGSTAQKTVEQALSYGENVTPELTKSIQGFPIRKELLKDVKGEGGMLGGLINPKGVAIRSGEALGKIAGSKVVTLPREFSRKILNSTDDKLKILAGKMSNNPVLSPFKKNLEEALKDSTKRDRLLWSLSQQPAFRESVNKIEEDELNNMDATLGQ
jgi:hypothetical protein